MLLIRPVSARDLDAMADLVNLTRGALTSLPVDRDLLRRRIAQSEAGFAADADRPGGELYTFVLEETASPGTLYGTCSVVSKTGGFEPFYCYALREERYESRVLGVNKIVRSLHLVEDHNGPSEVGGLFLRPGSRGGGYGRILSISRFLFMAGRPRAFDPEVVAEIRGWTDESGNSPFWDAVGRIFFSVDFATADALSFKEKQVIRDLMPDHPIYVDMLPRTAQQVIALEHDFASPARRLLESEGFAYRNRVDIFDAGPILQCPLEGIRAVMQSESVEVAALHGEPDEQPDHIVTNDRAGVAYRAVPAGVRRVPGDGVELPRAVADALDVRPGSPIRCVPIKPSRTGLAQEAELFNNMSLPEVP